MEVKIREMQPSDYDLVMQLWQNVNGVSITKNDTYDNIARFLARNPGHSFVAELGQSIVAALLCGHDGLVAHIYHLAVDASYRRQGLGTKLVDRAISTLDSEGISVCRLSVKSVSKVGKSFWQNLGWSEKGSSLIYTNEPLEQKVETQVMETVNL